MTLDELVVTVGAKIEHGDFQDVFALVDHIREAFEKVGEKIKELWHEGLDITDEAATHASHMRRIAMQYGMTVEQVEQLGWVAKATGGDLEGMAHGLKYLAKNASAAASEGGEAAKAFAGLVTKDAHGQLLPLTHLLENVADRFRGMPDGAQKAALALKLFGRSGTDMIPLLNKGREGIEELREEFEASGAALSEQALEEAKLYSWTKKRVGLAKEALETSFASRNLKAQTEMWARWTAVLKSEGAKRAVEVLSRSFNFLLRVVNLVGRAFTWLANQKWLVETALFAMVVAFGTLSVAAVQASMHAVMAAGSVVASWLAAGAPLWAIIGLLVLIGDEIWVTIQGGDSLINRARKWFDSVSEDNALVKALRWVQSLLHDISESAAWKLLKDLAGPLFSAAGATGKWLATGGAGEALASGLETTRELFGTQRPAFQPRQLAATSMQTSWGDMHQSIHAPINITVPSGSDAKDIGEHVRVAVREELGGHLQSAYAAHGGGR